ncbi:MAG TPA: hypothetical protein PLK54_11885, partial [Ferruginibacter sp.]|nr:hypothetical protein [Ferruginibacter sp.]
STGERIYIPYLNSMGIQFKEEKYVNCIVLCENLDSGQNARKFSLRLVSEKYGLVTQITGTTIGRKRVVTFPTMPVSTIGLSILEQKNRTAVVEIEAYLIDEMLIEK